MILMVSWLHEEEFDEMMASFEAEAEGLHSLIYPDIEPFLINLSVCFIIIIDCYHHY